MKKVGIVSLGYGWLPCEPGPSRFYHIAKTFCREGWDVDLITTSFQHFEKKPRDKERIWKQGYPFRISFIDVPSYRKNVGAGRVISDRIACGRVRRYLNAHRYDAVYCSIPSNDVAATVGRYCHERQIPFLIDIEDLWPEAMAMFVHNRALQKLIFPYFHRSAERAYRYADAVIGTSEDYTERATKYDHRSIPGETVFVGCDLEGYDRGVREFASQIAKEEGEFWVSYAGNIGISYDIRTLVLAARRILEEGYPDIKIKILGTGILKDACERLAREKDCTNVSFLGYMEYPKMAAYLHRSDLLVNSFVKGAPQSIVNKIGDYLASGRPMINTLENPVFTRLVEREGFGVNIVPEEEEILARTILALYQDEEKASRCGKNARRCAEEQFDRKVSYKRIVELADRLTEGKGGSFS